ncbi:MAG TPA: four helix bundle protein [Chryseosolibacter sp.]|nr:four helix bundle protein [Chryseosolibacter sp.]
MNKIELENRLIDFAVAIVKIVESMPSSKSATHIGGQMLRSGTSPALDYGEAQGGESRKDFIHKIKIVIKELRETLVCLRIAQRAVLYDRIEELEKVIKENNELISIFVKSAQTAESNNRLFDNRKTQVTINKGNL